MVRNKEPGVMDMLLRRKRKKERKKERKKQINK
jgi:hypothetical protein